LVPLKEYICNGKKYRIYPPTEKDRKAVGVASHNVKAFSANGNQAAIFNEFVSMLAVVLTPEGMDPATKDREEVRKEILTLPFGFIIVVMVDVARTTEDRRR
jgi:hypothetical protein